MQPRYNGCILLCCEGMEPLQNETKITMYGKQRMSMMESTGGAVVADSYHFHGQLMWKGTKFRSSTLSKGLLHHSSYNQSDKQRKEHRSDDIKKHRSHTCHAFFCAKAAVEFIHEKQAGRGSGERRNFTLEGWDTSLGFRCRDKCGLHKIR